MNTIIAEQTAIISTPCRLSQREFLTALARIKCRSTLMLSCVIIIMMLACALFFDIRWMIVALMFLTIIVPGIMIFLYFSYAMSPRCLPCVHHHYIKAQAETLSIIYTVRLPAGEGEESQEKTVIVDVPRHDIDTCHPGLDEFTITMRHPFGLLKLPYSSLPDSRQFAEWVKSGKS